MIAWQNYGGKSWKSDNLRTESKDHVQSCHEKFEHACHKAIKIF